ncbi:MAG: PAS domain-containing protein, partial [Anaerolineae bacterium]
WDYEAGDRHWRLRVFALMNPGIAGAVIRHEDVTAEWQDASGARLRLAEAETAMAALPGAFFVLAADLTVREANGPATELSTRPLVGRELMRCLTRPDADAVGAALADVGAGASAAWRDAQAGDGGTVRRWSVRPLAGLDDGQPRGFVAMATDVSDLVRRGGDAALLDKAARAAPVGMAMVEGEGDDAKIRWANAAFAAMAGRPPESVAGQRLAEFLGAAGRYDDGALQKLLASPAPDRRVSVRRYDGAAWELAGASAGGALCLTAADVADRERALEALTELRRRLQGALNGSDEGAWEWDESTGQGWMSPQALDLLRLPADTPPERFDAVIERIHRAERHRLRTLLQEAAVDGGRLDVQVRLDLPEETWVEIRGRAARGGRRVAGTLRDVTEACRARESLESRERRAVLALRGGGLGTWSGSSRSRRIRVDNAARRLHGEAAEAGHVGLREWLHRVAPADRRRVLESLRSPGPDGRIQVAYRLAGDNRWLALEGQRLERESDGYWRVDGVCRDITPVRQAAEAAERASGISRATLDALPGLAARVNAEGRLTWTNRAWDRTFPDATSLVEALGRRRRAEWDSRLRETLDGATQRGPLMLPVEGRPRQMEAFWSPVAADEALLLMQDLTDQREAENRLFQARKMESVGQLAGGAAREFNNLLGVVIGNLELLEAGAAADPAARRRVAAALGAAQQGAAVTERLLAFARQHDAEPEPVDPTGFVRARADLFGRQVGEGCILEFALADDAWPVQADPGQLETALL